MKVSASAPITGISLRRQTAPRPETLFGLPYPLRIRITSSYQTLAAFGALHRARAELTSECHVERMRPTKSLSQLDFGWQQTRCDQQMTARPVRNVSKSYLQFTDNPAVKPSDRLYIANRDRAAWRLLPFAKTKQSSRRSGAFGCCGALRTL